MKIIKTIGGISRTVKVILPELVANPLSESRHHFGWFIKMLPRVLLTRGLRVGKEVPNLSLFNLDGNPIMLHEHIPAAGVCVLIFGSFT